MSEASENTSVSPDGLPRKRGRRPARGVSEGLQLNLNSGAARHAAEQFRSWVQALGGADSVSPQEATLLRHASYLATLADALWYQVCTSGFAFAADALAKHAGACATLLRACGLARRACEASSAPSLRELAALAPSVCAPLASAAARAPATPATLWPPAPLDAQGTPLAETLASLSEATARSAAAPGAPLAFYASAGEQASLPGLETPSERSERKQYLFSSASEQARRLRKQRAAKAGSAGAQARWKPKADDKESTP